MKKIRIRQGIWFRQKHIILTFPNGWRIDRPSMTADKWKVLSLSDMAKAIDNPIGGKRLEDIARGKKEVIILFDDMARPTRPYRIISHILSKLHYVGIKKENIRFIVSPGSHGICTLQDFRKKLGNSVIGNYPVYNHNCFENCAYIGKTTSGVPLYINREFLLCDLKIGIGCVVPHLYCGFSGGGKIILPGISHIRTIDAFHSLSKGISGFGKIRANIRVKTIYEAVRLSNFQFKIDFIVNTNGDEVACFAGDPVEEYKEAVKIAERAYLTPHQSGYDVIIANAFVKSNEADIAIHNTIHLLNPKGGIFVLVTHNPAGQINHYLFRSYGRFIRGRQYKKMTFLRPNVKYIIFSPYKDFNAFDTFDKSGLLIWKNSWPEILEIIKKDFANPKVAVFDDATIQLLQ
jgi:nickel-dependent lactate racemase